LTVLLDEGVPHPLVRSLSPHGVKTVAEMGWAGVKNGELLKLVAEQGFNVFLTGDKNMQNQQRLVGRPFAILLLSAISWPVIRKHLPAILAAIDQTRPGSVDSVNCGSFLRRRDNRRSEPPV